MRLDDIPVRSLAILNSPDVHDWPVTTQITKLDLTPDGVHIEFDRQTGANRWPDILITPPDQTLQYTLWICLQIASTWWAAGVIEYWFGLDKNGGPVDQYADHWYYDPIRWTPMTGHQPAVGELVGFFITSGDARHGTDHVGNHERSNIVAINFPTAAGQSFSWPVGAPVNLPPQPPALPPVQPPAAPPGVPPVVPPAADLVARVQALERDSANFRTGLFFLADKWSELAAIFNEIDQVLNATKKG